MVDCTEPKFVKIRAFLKRHRDIFEKCGKAHGEDQIFSRMFMVKEHETICRV